MWYPEFPALWGILELSWALPHVVLVIPGIIRNSWTQLSSTPFCTGSSRDYEEFLSWAITHLLPGIPGIMRNSWVELLPIWYQEFPALWRILELSSCPFGTGNSRHYEEFLSWALAHLVPGITGIMRNSWVELMPIYCREFPALWAII